MSVTDFVHKPTPEFETTFEDFWVNLDGYGTVDGPKLRHKTEKEQSTYQMMNIVHRDMILFRRSLRRNPKRMWRVITFSSKEIMEKLNRLVWKKMLRKILGNLVTMTRFCMGTRVEINQSLKLVN